MRIKAYSANMDGVEFATVHTVGPRFCALLWTDAAGRTCRAEFSGDSAEADAREAAIGLLPLCIQIEGRQAQCFAFNLKGEYNTDGTPVEADAVTV